MIARRAHSHNTNKHQKKSTRMSVCVVCVYTHMQAHTPCCFTPYDRLSVQIKWLLNLGSSLRGGDLMTTTPRLSLSFSCFIHSQLPLLSVCVLLAIYLSYSCHFTIFALSSSFTSHPLPLSLPPYPQNQFSVGLCRADL